MLSAYRSLCRSFSAGLASLPCPMPSLYICIAHTCFWCPSFETPWWVISVKGQTSTFWSPFRQGCLGVEHSAYHWTSHLYFDPRIVFCAAVCLRRCLTCVDMVVIGKWLCFSMCLPFVGLLWCVGKPLCSFSGHRFHLLAQKVLYRAAAWVKSLCFAGNGWETSSAWLLGPEIQCATLVLLGFLLRKWRGVNGKPENESSHSVSDVHFLAAPSCYNTKGTCRVRY